jgi:hypothetical protein
VQNKIMKLNLNIPGANAVQGQPFSYSISSVASIIGRVRKAFLAFDPAPHDGGVEDHPSDDERPIESDDERPIESDDERPVLCNPTNTYRRRPACDRPVRADDERPVLCNPTGTKTNTYRRRPACGRAPNHFWNEDWYAT